jgi:hypothetical protein
MMPQKYRNNINWNRVVRLQLVFILSYVPFITILSPQSLVDSHKESLRKALEQYK